MPLTLPEIPEAENPPLVRQLLLVSSGDTILISGSTGSTIMAHSPAAADTLSLGVTKWVA